MEDNYIRGRRAKLLLYEDSMSELDLQELEKIIGAFNEIGCTSFMLDPKQIVIEAKRDSTIQELKVINDE